MRIVGSVHLLLFVLAMLFTFAATSPAQVAVAITFGPPAIPVYVQPPCPAAGYIWVPGYWAYDYNYDDYFWVPGTWVLAPESGFFWTPGYWAWTGNQFVFYDGYWGPVVGFYGGINYGYGYFGNGYVGGRWENGQFYYNRAVTNVNVTNIRNVYNNTTVINNTNISRVSYNGGNGGINARPTPQQEAAARERHIAPVAAQTQQVQAARADSQLRASVNLGKPPVAATPMPGALHDRAAVPAREAGAPYTPAPNRAVGKPGPANTRTPNAGNAVPRPGAAIHPNELPPRQAPPPPNTGNAKLDQKYVKQQEKLQARQEKEQQKLQQKQDQEHQRMQQRAADEARRQQMEQRHEQQTQQMQEKQMRQQQTMQEKQQQQQQQRPPKQERPPGPPQ